jgi:hypothetical protein
MQIADSNAAFTSGECRKAWLSGGSAVFLLLFLVLSPLAHAQSIPEDLRSILVDTFHFKKEELSKMQQGQPVTKIIHSDDPEDLRLMGVVLIEADQQKFIEAYKDIVHFETGKEVIRTGKFSDPPVEADLAEFHAPDLNKKDIMACRPGKCVYKLPLYAIEDLQKRVDWSAADAKQQADAIVRKLWIDYLVRYRREGNRALATYYDTPVPFSVAGGLEELAASATEAKARVPELFRYLESYPNEKPPGTEEFFYWQEAAFGLKPIVRSSHVVIEKLERPEGSRYLIASQMLFASHYFRAALELKYVCPVQTDSGKRALYFLTYQHSYVDGMTGFSGSILRRVVPGRSQASLAENLRLAKQTVEGKVK